METIDITCTYCEEGPGKLCKSKGGRTLVYFHKPRDVSAQKLSENEEPPQIEVAANKPKKFWRRIFGSAN